MKFSTPARALALALAYVAISAASARAGDDDAALLRRVVDAQHATLHGVVAYHTDSRLRSGAGFFHRNERESRWFVLSDGVLERTGVMAKSDAPFGKHAEAQTHEPWGPYSNEYTFHAVACADCAPGRVAFTFESATHDELHGHGTLVVDAEHERIEHEDFVPYVLFDQAKTGDVTIEFGESAIGWMPRALGGTFTGSMGPFTGTADLRERFEDYRRFDSVDRAVEASGT